MHKIKILTVGKTKEPWLEDAIAEYLKRLQKDVKIEFVLAKNNQQLISAVNKESLILCLDSSGEMMTSEGFSSFIMNKLEEGARASLLS